MACIIVEIPCGWQAPGGRRAGFTRNTKLEYGCTCMYVCMYVCMCMFMFMYMVLDHYLMTLELPPAIGTHRATCYFFYRGRRFNRMAHGASAPSCCARQWPKRCLTPAGMHPWQLHLCPPMLLLAAVPLSVLAPLPFASAGPAVNKMPALLVAHICWHDILLEQIMPCGAHTHIHAHAC